MKQKGTKRSGDRRGLKILFLLLGAVLFAVAQKVLFSARAQELIPAGRDSKEAVEETSVSVEQLLGALESGGLLSIGNLGIKADDLKKIAADSQPVLAPNQPTENSDVVDPNQLNNDTFEYLESQGGLIAGASTAKMDSASPTIFKLAAKFLDEVVFKNYTEFFKKAKFDEGFEITGQPTFDQDTAGYAIIKKGNQSVQIDFEKKYKAAPVVTATLSVQFYDDPEVRAAAEDLLLISDVKYVVTNVTSRGFEIVMDRVADSDIPFSWHALAVRNPKVFSKEAKNEKSGDPGKGEGGLFTGNDISQPADSVMGIIKQSTDSFPSPAFSGEDSSQNAGPANISGSGGDQP